MNLDQEISHFATLCQQTTRASNYPEASGILSQVPIYQGQELLDTIETPRPRLALLNEWRCCLEKGPGVFVVRDGFSAQEIIDEMTNVFRDIIAEEQAHGSAKGDHFGTNERIWNSLEKSVLKAPHLFADYYGNSLIALACQAWLGPFYQLTAQVNIVKPGSQAQSPHRDYHLGFQSDETSALFPEHAQVMSQFLTLQGAIVHNDMPIESGPTQLLPYSQQYTPGYLQFRHPVFVDYFRKHAIQLAMKKGDLLFFNPALFHAAGSNHSETDRIANLIQISSAFGRPMESVNRYRMIEAVYPELVKRKAATILTELRQHDVIAALAEGYSFPTNLDSDPPTSGTAPRSQASYLSEALDDSWSMEKLLATLNNLDQRRKA